MNRIILFLFLFVCIPLRCLLVWWASLVENKRQTDEDKYNTQFIFISVLTLFIGFGFIIVNLLRHNDIIKNRGAFGEKVYWSGYLHGILYILFALLWIFKIPLSYIVLALDVCIGFLTFIIHYFI